MVRVVGRRIEGGRMMKRRTCRARMRRMRRSRNVLGFVGLKIMRGHRRFVELEILAINLFFDDGVGLLVPSGVLPHVTASFCGSSSGGEPVSISSDSRSPLVNAFFLSRSWEGGDASRSRLGRWVPDDMHLLFLHAPGMGERRGSAIEVQ